MCIRDRVSSTVDAVTGQGNGKQEDELLDDAVKIVLESGQASISMIQRDVYKRQPEASTCK